MRSRRTTIIFFVLAGGAFVALTILHAAAVPLMITMDGHRYIELAEILGSGRFDASSWPPLRTPLFPLLLNVAFTLFGKGVFAAQAVTISLGIAGCLLIADSVRVIAGKAAAAAFLLLAAFDPSLVVFENMVLTETGTFFFIALLVHLTVAMPIGLYTRLFSIAFVFAAAYYWRQSILALMPFFALLMVLEAGRNEGDRRRRWTATLAALVIVVLPLSLKWLWTRQFPPGKLKDLNLIHARLFLLRQWVIDPNAPEMAPVRADYLDAIRHAEAHGPVSGIRWVDVTNIAIKLGDPPRERSWPIRVVLRSPRRYAAGVARTLAFFSGFNGAENEIEWSRGRMLSPLSDRTVIEQGPPATARRNEILFTREAAPGPWRTMLRALAKPYDLLRIVASLTAVAVAAAAAWRHDWKMLALAGTPVVFALVHALGVMSNNRFMMPVYPIVLAAAIAGVSQLVTYCLTLLQRSSA